ncbi:glycosyltransferase [Calothrix sp. 336/3]|uniref:glycosyltransferase n=1 Tax=Calothrix sp. 336/3 TaxID=1337936 RepID=UPI0004E434C8|nr:glycosyltransferase [Calothrix sp. 336/3]AKG24196.1 glycosyltransferase [Calothrix sp. 336/3]
MEDKSLDPDINKFLPQVSVVIPIYNGEKDVRELIDCLQAQIYPSELVEYLLVDNNSSDRTLALISEIAAQSKITICPVSEKLIQSSYAARNRGIRQATGEIIAFTDADCRPQPQWLSQLIAPLENQEVVMVAGEIMALPGDSFLERYADSQETLSQKHTLAHKFYPYGQTANLAIRRFALEKVGLFRPYLTTGGDADICWRIQQANLGRLEFAPLAITQHRHRTTLEELASQWQRYGRSNRYLHELHGVELMREISLKECGYRLMRWFLKELPQGSIHLVKGKGTMVNLLNTPIGLYTARKRYLGQTKARLPEKAKEIEWL